ncbi:hypothetical protein BZG36_01824 [Bifiguratus adelaidae]|uniref:Prefoldin subunit 1 n=1 Tax=Bifiguratus adelaidae TaxID=1938954 RepID=A0A261Y272_9FUNG|nr:hypothetical protein BZG36_01824 [Bifiguratus adelaidae]
MATLSDETVRRVFMEVQNKLIESNRQVNSIKTQIASKEREKKLAELTLRELNTLQDDTPTYKPIGKMFCVAPLRDLKASYATRSKTVEEEVKKLPENARRPKTLTEKLLKILMRAKEFNLGAPAAKHRSPNKPKFSARTQSSLHSKWDHKMGIAETPNLPDDFLRNYHQTRTESKGLSPPSRLKADPNTWAPPTSRYADGISRTMLGRESIILECSGARAAGEGRYQDQLEAEQAPMAVPLPKKVRNLLHVGEIKVIVYELAQALMDIAAERED